MAIRIFEVRNAENEVVMTLQGKQLRTMRGAVQDYIRSGRLPYGEYRVEMIAKEGERK